jgi:hypothetical protein
MVQLRSLKSVLVFETQLSFRRNLVDLHMVAIFHKLITLCIIQNVSENFGRFLLLFPTI